MSSPPVPAREVVEPREARETTPLWIRGAFVLIPLSVAVVFISVLAIEAMPHPPDLQVLTPYGGMPGRTMAVRAFLFVPTSGPEELTTRSVRTAYRIEDEEGRVLSEGELTPSPPGYEEPEDGQMGASEGYVPSFGMEGVVTLPDAVGDYWLVAEAPLDDGDGARCRVPLRVRDEPRLPTPSGFPMHPLAQWELFPVEVAEGATPPDALELRAIGGHCLSDRRCEALVWVGEPAAAITVEPHVGLTLAAGPTPAEETAGFVRLGLDLVGPEGELTIVAHRDGAEVARRRVRLPVLLAGFGYEGQRALQRGDAIVASTANAPYIVDAYKDRRWERTASFGDVPPDLTTLPIGEVDPGLWRVQVRDEAFGAETSATRFSYVMGPGESEHDALRAIRARLIEEEAGDAFTRAMPIDGVVAEDQARFALSLLEMEYLPPPRPMSGRFQAESALDEDRVLLRWLAAAMLLALGLVVAGYMLRRGLVAAAEARAVMEAAGSEVATTGRTRVAMTLTVLGMVLAVALAFASAAVLLLSRGL